MALATPRLNDKAIMHDLGISHRTVSRRIAELMESIGGSTRFQAGWLAATVSRDGK